MSNKALFCLSYAASSAVLLWIFVIIDGHKIHVLDDRITALEQSQCSIKQDKVHADYKLNICIAQLRSKP